MVPWLKQRNKKDGLRVREANQQRSAPVWKISRQHKEFVGPPRDPGAQIMLLEKVAYLLCTRDRVCSHEVCTHESGPHFPLHDSILLKRFDRTASFFDGFSHQLFAAGLFES